MVTENEIYTSHEIKEETTLHVNAAQDKKLCATGKSQLDFCLVCPHMYTLASRTVTLQIIYTVHKILWHRAEY